MKTTKKLKVIVPKPKPKPEPEPKPKSKPKPAPKDVGDAWTRFIGSISGVRDE